jgi:hypothetical protein
MELRACFPDASEEKLRELLEFRAALQGASDEQLRDFLRGLADIMPPGSAIAIPIEWEEAAEAEEAEAHAKLLRIEAILERKDLTAEQKCAAWDALLKSDTTSGVPAGGEQGFQGGTSGEARRPTGRVEPAAAAAEDWERRRTEAAAAETRHKREVDDRWWAARGGRPEWAQPAA